MYMVQKKVFPEILEAYYSDEKETSVVYKNYIA